MNEIEFNRMESSADLVSLVYQIAFRHPPDPEGLRDYARRLDWGMTPLEFLREIYESEEFKASEAVLKMAKNWDLMAAVGAEIIMPLRRGGKLCGPAKNKSLFQDLLNLNGIIWPHIFEAMEEYLHEGDMFVDVGANLGYFTILASKIVGPTGKVLSYEPFSENFRFLLENIKLNDLKNVNAAQLGLWDTSMRKGVLETAPNMSRIIDGDDVDVVTLDSLDIKPEMIKLMLEGSETFALRGMAHTLEDCRPILLLQFNPVAIVVAGGKITDFWRELDGYRVYHIPGKKLLKSFEELRRICPDHSIVDLLAMP